MIIDHIRNAGLYSSISPTVSECLDYMAFNDCTLVEDGKHPLGNKTVISVSTYTTITKEARGWEAHDHCIDIQYVADGTELLYYANREQLTFSHSCEGKDKLVYTGEGNSILLKKGYFAILFPEDAHISKVTAQNPEVIKKLVFKVKL